MKYFLNCGKTILNNHGLKNSFLMTESFPYEIIRCYGSNKKQQKQVPVDTKSKPKWSKNNARKTGIQIDDTNYTADFLKRQIVDPVWLMKEYPTQVYSCEQAITFHKEIAQEVMFNNMNGFVVTKLFLDMTSKKKGKFMDNIKGNINFPHAFVDGLKKEVIAICKKEEEIVAAKKAGALHSGFGEVLKLIEKGEIIEASYDYLVCTPEALSEVAILKKKLGARMPSVKSKTVDENITELVKRFHLSKNFEVSKSSDDSGVLKMNIGIINMETEKLVDNLSSLIKQIIEYKKFSPETFIKSCELWCPPSIEKFLIDVKPYLPLDESDLEDNEEGDATKASEKA